MSKIKPVFEGLIGAAALGVLGWAMMNDVRDPQPDRWGVLWAAEPVGKNTVCHYTGEDKETWHMTVIGDCPGVIQAIYPGGNKKGAR